MPSFDADIKPLFREFDRTEMEFVFDLWNFDDVKEHAASILERLEDGDMPCDEVWPEERIELFRSWMNGGMDA